MTKWANLDDDLSHLKKLTPFEKVRDNAEYFVASCMLMASIQDIVKTYNENLHAIDILDWEHDKEDLATLGGVIKTQRELGDALVDAANKLELVLNINA